MANESNKTATGMLALETKDLLRESLCGSLFHCFLRAGYSDKECAKLVAIAMGPVVHALQLAHAAYKFHVEAISTMQSVNPIYPVMNFDAAANKVPKKP
jgi:hypothetical protein